MSLRTSPRFPPSVSSTAMLVGVDTGYEGKFDFPRRAVPPERAYLIATVPRTGSTWFSHLLWQTGCLGAPLEYLNFEPAGPYFFAANSRSAQTQLWESALRRRTSANGVFGVKCFPSQLEALQQSNPDLLAAFMATLFGRSGEARIVLLERRDPVAHAISYARATISGVWRKEQEGERSEVAYSEVAVERARKLLDGQAAAWKQMFGDLGIEPLHLSYEELTSDPRITILQVAEYLGVAIDPEKRIGVPMIERQSEADAKAWADRYSDNAQSAGAS